MLISKRYIITIYAALIAFTAFAGPLEEGKRLYNNGDYQAAVEQLQAAVRRTPRDGNANFYLGASLAALGDFDAARPYLAKAAERNVVAAYPLLIRGEIDSYQPTEASAHIDAWRSYLNRNRRAIPDELDQLASKVVKMKNMMARVEKIEVLDSIVVPKSDFFTAYRLSAPAGRILPSEAVHRIAPQLDGTLFGTAFMPDNRTEMLWAQADTAGVVALYGTGILDDGSPECPEPLDGDLGEGASATFPFLMPDGVTLYFANNGENSLGGYDIFMTRREHNDDGNTYFQPQNVGMPYNSPYDDYLLAIDEDSGLGWFATDRNQIPDSVTVYVFIPSQMRVNVDADDPNIASLARLSDISLTRTPETDVRSVLASRLPAAAAENTSGSTVFTLDMGNGHIYTSLADFRSSAARSAMVEYLGAEASLRRHLEAEKALRERYAAGDMRVAADILDSEHDTALQRRHLRELRNNVIRLESNR